MDIRTIEISEEDFKAFKKTDIGLLRNAEYFVFDTGQIGTTLDTGEKVLLKVTGRSGQEKRVAKKPLTKNQRKALRRKRNG